MDDLWKKQSLQIGNIIIPIACGIIAAVSSTSIGEAFVGSSCRELVSPAPTTLATWGVIFLFLGMFMLYQARDLFRPLDEKVDMPYLYQVGELFMLSTIAATAWYLLCLRRLTWPSVAAIAVCLILVLAAYLRLNINKAKRPLEEHLFITVGWSLYAGWVTAIVMASVAAGFASIGLARLTIIGEEIWVAIVPLAAVLVYLLALFNRNDYIFASVGVWAILGIILEPLNPANAPQPQAVLAAVAGAITLAAAVVARAFLAVRQRKPRVPRVKDLGRG